MSAKCWPDILSDVGFVGLRALDQHSSTTVGNYVVQISIMMISFVNVWPTIQPTKCQHWPNNKLLSGQALVKIYGPKEFNTCISKRGIKSK